MYEKQIWIRHKAVALGCLRGWCGVELPAVAAPYRLVREGMREREKVMMNFVTRAPDLLLICTCNAMGAHNQELVGSPPPPSGYEVKREWDSVPYRWLPVGVTIQHCTVVH
jgi:hypothetical protein